MKVFDVVFFVYQYLLHVFIMYNGTVEENDIQEGKRRNIFIKVNDINSFLPGYSILSYQPENLPGMKQEFTEEEPHSGKINGF
ncbi:hypothetical protein ES705_39411 [subsurface metagenome]